MSTTIPLKSDPRGQSHAIDVDARGMDPHQLVRELVHNGAEADARNIWIDGYTDPVTGQICMRITDDGHGMTEAHMRKHLSTLYSSGKTIGINFGIGARVAALPFNHAGVDFASRTVDGPDGLMRLHRDMGIYGVATWPVLDDEEYEVQRDYVAADAGELSRLPKKARTGTAVILRGDGKRDTFDSLRGWDTLRYLSTHYFEIPGNPTVRVEIDGVMRTMTPFANRLAKLAEHSGTIPFEDVAGLTGRFHWWVLPEQSDDRRASNGLFVTAGVGLLHAGETFSLARTYSAEFGLLYKAVSQRVVILADIDGALMETGRSNLILPRGGKSIPWKRLGAAFAESMPDEIDELLSAYTVSSPSISAAIAALLDPEWFKKLKPRKFTAPAINGDETTGEEGGAELPNTLGDLPRAEHSGGQGTRTPTDRTRNAAGTSPARKRNVVSLPNVEFVDVEQVDDTWQHIRYVESSSTVQVARDCPPYIRDIDRWMAATGHARGIVQGAVEAAYSLELAAAVIDANGQDRHGIDPATIAAMKEPAALLMKLLGVQALERTIQQWLTDISRVTS